MAKKVTAYKVENLNKVDTSRYVEGDLFITKKSVGILIDGMIMNLVTPLNLRNYVKKNDVQKMIDKALKEVKE